MPALACASTLRPHESVVIKTRLVPERNLKDRELQEANVCTGEEVGAIFGSSSMF